MLSKLSKLFLQAAVAVAAAAAAQPAAAATGPPVDLAQPPEGSASWARACSMHHPICVHAAPGTPAPTILAVLASADRAWATLTGALDVPAPALVDGAWHVYLVDSVDGGSLTRAQERDPIARLDRASSFALVDRRFASECGRDLAVARAVARGALWAVAPATDEGSARAEAQMLARLVAPCADAGDDESIFQAQPERTLVDPESPPFDRGAAMFFDWLDANFAANPGALLAGMWALAATVTPASSATWKGTPNGFDVLRVSLKGALSEESTFDDVVARFAVHRALSAPKVRLAWHVPWPAKARRFASPVPVAPTGASYVVVDLAGAPAKASLRVEAQWEDFGRMRWEVVKLDAQGHEMADVTVTSLPLGTMASMTVEPLEGVDRVIVVGVGLGSTDHPFDPDQGWWEPHGWLLTVEGE